MKIPGRLDHEFIGSEFDWIALDSCGATGYFSTAGEGWIPETVLINPDPFWDSLDLILSLPRLGEPQGSFSGSHSIEDWLKVAARGVYAFDWNRRTKRYELVARPVSHLVPEAFGKIAQLASLTQLPCRFSSIPTFL